MVAGEDPDQFSVFGQWRRTKDGRLEVVGVRNFGDSVFKFA